jgi:hypothetical protein
VGLFSFIPFLALFAGEKTFFNRFFTLDRSHAPDNIVLANLNFPFPILKNTQPFSGLHHRKSEKISLSFEMFWVRWQI